MPKMLFRENITSHGGIQCTSGVAAIGNTAHSPIRTLKYEHRSVSAQITMQNVQYLAQLFAALGPFRKYASTSRASSVSVYTAI